MSEANIQTARTLSEADVFQFQDECLRTKQYQMLGRVKCIVFEAAAGANVPRPEITKEIGDRKANISSISTRPMGDGRSTIRLVLQVEDQSRLDTILKALRRAKGVVGVERLRHAPASGGS